MLGLKQSHAIQIIIYDLIRADQVPHYIHHFRFRQFFHLYFGFIRHIMLYHALFRKIEHCHKNRMRFYHSLQCKGEPVHVNSIQKPHHYREI